jgi:hypothetical protein
MTLRRVKFIAVWIIIAVSVIGLAAIPVRGVCDLIASAKGVQEANFSTGQIYPIKLGRAGGSRVVYVGHPLYLVDEISGDVMPSAAAIGVLMIAGAISRFRRKP